MSGQLESHHYLQLEAYFLKAVHLDEPYYILTIVNEARDCMQWFSRLGPTVTRTPLLHVRLRHQ